MIVKDQLSPAGQNCCHHHPLGENHCFRPLVSVIMGLLEKAGGKEPFELGVEEGSSSLGLGDTEEGQRWAVSGFRRRLWGHAPLENC